MRMECKEPEPHQTMPQESMEAKCFKIESRHHVALDADDGAVLMAVSKKAAFERRLTSLSVIGISVCTAATVCNHLPQLISFFSQPTPNSKVGRYIPSHSHSSYLRRRRKAHEGYVIVNVFSVFVAASLTEIAR